VPLDATDADSLGLTNSDMLACTACDCKQQHAATEIDVRESQ